MARLLPFGGQLRAKGSPLPALGAAVAEPPGHLEPRVGHGPAIADDMDEPRLGEDLVEKADPRPAGQLVDEGVHLLRGRPREEELAEAPIQPGGDVRGEQVASRCAEHWRELAIQSPIGLRGGVTEAPLLGCPGRQSAVQAPIPA